MKPITAHDPFRIGIIAIVVAGLLGLVVLGVSVIPFGKASYTAMLAQTAGLRVSEDVKVHGVPVGQITGIKLDGDQVKVTFTVSKGVRLGDKTSAAVKVATLLGTHYLDVRPSGSGEISRIPLSRTAVPYNLQDVLEKGTGTLQKLDPLLLAKALTEASKTLMRPVPASALRSKVSRGCPRRSQPGAARPPSCSPPRARSPTSSARAVSTSST